MKFCDASRNQKSLRFWKFQLSILTNKKVLFLMEHEIVASRYLSKTVHLVWFSYNNLVHNYTTAILSFCKHLIQPMTAQRWSVFPVMYCYWLKYMLKKYYVQQKKLPVISSAKKCGRSKDDSDITRFQGIDFTIQLEVFKIWTLAWAGLARNKV